MKDNTKDFLSMLGIAIFFISTIGGGLYCLGTMNNFDIDIGEEITFDLGDKITQTSSFNGWYFSGIVDGSLVFEQSAYEKTMTRYIPLEAQFITLNDRVYEITEIYKTTVIAVTLLRWE